MIVVMQDIGTQMQDLRLLTEDKATARRFADGMLAQFAGSSSTDTSGGRMVNDLTPHQIGEEFPLHPDFIDRGIRTL